MRTLSITDIVKHSEALTTSETKHAVSSPARNGPIRVLGLIGILKHCSQGCSATSVICLEGIKYFQVNVRDGVLNVT